MLLLLLLLLNVRMTSAAGAAAGTAGAAAAHQRGSGSGAALATAVGAAAASAGSLVKFSHDVDVAFAASQSRLYVNDEDPYARSSDYANDHRDHDDSFRLHGNEIGRSAVFAIVDAYTDNSILSSASSSASPHHLQIRLLFRLSQRIKSATGVPSRVRRSRVRDEQNLIASRQEMPGGKLEWFLILHPESAGTRIAAGEAFEDGGRAPTHSLVLDGLEKVGDFEDGEGGVSDDGSCLVGRRAGIDAFVDGLYFRYEKHVLVGALHVHASIARGREIVPSVLLPRDFRRGTTVGGTLETSRASGFDGRVYRNLFEYRKSVDVDVGALGIGGAELIADHALVESGILVPNIEEVEDGREARDGVVLLVRRGVIIDRTISDQNVVFLPLESYRGYR